MKKTIFLLAVALLISLQLNAQKKIINIPDIPGYITLKCDFHIHTVFSDGLVWPTYRVDEAWKDGLDALAISDHLEIQPKKKYIPTDHNAAYEVAKNLANQRNLILVHATEITRAMPPGHLNALFVTDAAAIYVDDPAESIEAAVKQGAFIQWNHPGWKSQEPDGIPKLYDMHRDLLAKNYIHGIEYFNYNEFYPKVLKWCNEYNLAVIANSDEHEIIIETYQDYCRPLTLVFAEERTEESLKEAMFDARTLAYYYNTLAGPENLLRQVFEASISVSKPYFENDSHFWIEVSNDSDIPFRLTNGNEGASKEFMLGANSVTTVRIAKNSTEKREWDVKNLLSGPNECLRIELEL